MRNVVRVLGPNWEPAFRIMEDGKETVVLVENLSAQEYTKLQNEVLTGSANEIHQ